MTTNIFNVGDNVQLITDRYEDYGRKVGDIGVIRFEGSDGGFGVEFETKKSNNNTCSGYCKSERGLWINSDELKLVYLKFQNEEPEKSYFELEVISKTNGRIGKINGKPRKKIVL